MKITKFLHSCLLVETEGRTVLFDPGEFSIDVFDFSSLTTLDDIFITHEHGDHFDLTFIKRLVELFPEVRITTTNSIVTQLAEQGIVATNIPPEGVEFFESPHEGHQPMFNPPEEIGVHYLNILSHPGDSHSFNETKDVLALPIAAPWGSTDRAVQLALGLRPKAIIPIHDWHWREEVTAEMYERLEKLFAKEGITFYKMQTGEPVEVTV